MSINYRYEYRVNKKGAECFRTDTYEKAAAKLKELQDKKPNVRFDIQSRSVRLDKYGVALRDHLGRPRWSPWE